MTVLAFAPACAVLAFRVVLPAHGPAVAGAVPASESGSIILTPHQTRPTPAQSELRAVMDQIAAGGFGDSPIVMRRREPLSNAADSPAGDRMNPPTRTPITTPVVMLTSIMAAGEQAIAVIDGRVRRPGDTIAPGWSVAHIDRAAGTVTLNHTSGVSHVLTLRSRQGP
ncbi:MAG: hypothetical protein HBSAPP03_04000 [Phycisphaerae bacterium]|nr:MAG: hypothetical protein HBSAPP03_04000 [Phycisphaerae bacterium]